MVRLVAICCAVLFLTAGCLYPLLPFRPPPSTKPLPPAGVNSFSLSPDGRFLYFGYYLLRGDGTQAFYEDRQVDWRTGQITRRQMPFSFGFTDDANTVFRVLLDDNPNRYEQVPEAIALYDHPSFQPKRTVTLSKMPQDDPQAASRGAPWKQVHIVDVNIAAGQALCIFSGGGLPGTGLCLYDLTTGKYTIVVPAKAGFSSLSSYRLLARDEVFFVASRVSDEGVKSELRAIGRDFASIYESVPYRVRTGGKPQIVYQDILRRSVDIRSVTPTQYASSCGGRRVAFIDIAPGDEERTRRRGGYRFDVYVREGDSQRAVTNLKTRMSTIAISCDGSTVAMRVEEPQNEPSIVDLNTNQVVPLRLIDRLLSDPSFRE